MQVEKNKIKNWYIKKRKWNYWRTGRVIEKFLSVKRLDGFVLCIQGWRKTSSSKFLATKKRLRVVNKGRLFLYRHFEFRRKIWKNVGLLDI